MPSSRGIFPDQGLNPCLSHCRQILYHLSHQGSPINGIYPFIFHIVDFIWYHEIYDTISNPFDLIDKLLEKKKKSLLACLNNKMPFISCLEPSIFYSFQSEPTCLICWSPHFTLFHTVDSFPLSTNETFPYFKVWFEVYLSMMYSLLYQNEFGYAFIVPFLRTFVHYQGIIFMCS